MQQQFLQRPTIYFLTSRPINEENSIAIQGQKVENREYCECAESDSFPLCYASFEFLRYIHKISKKAQKLDDMTSLEIDNEKGKQLFHQSQPMEERTTCHEMLNHKEGDERDEQLEPALHPHPSFDEQ